MMLKQFLTLGVGYPTTDEEVRRAYLNLVKRYPPEHHPEEFARVAEAYEALRDETRRIHTALAGFLMLRYPEDEILDTARAGRLKCGRVGLTDLIRAERPS
jgi:hypothetical protein